MGFEQRTRLNLVGCKNDDDMINDLEKQSWHGESKKPLEMATHKACKRSNDLVLFPTVTRVVLVLKCSTTG